MLHDLAAGVCVLSKGFARSARPAVMLLVVSLLTYGLYSAIADVLDPELVGLNRGGIKDIRELIHGVMEGEQVETSGLPEKARDYVKTARVLMGDALYSHAWLES